MIKNKMTIRVMEHLECKSSVFNTERSSYNKSITIICLTNNNNTYIIIKDVIGERWRELHG